MPPTCEGAKVLLEKRRCCASRARCSLCNWIRLQHLLQHLSENSLYNVTTNIRETVAPSLVFVNKFFMIVAEQAEYRCLKVMNVHGIFDDVVPKFICFAIYEPRFYAAPAIQILKHRG